MCDEVAGEDSERGAEEDDRAVGMLARAAAAHFERPPPQALKIGGVGAALGYARAGVSKRAEAEEARSALGRALGREVPHDAGHVADRASALGQEADDAAAETQSLGAKRIMLELQRPRLLAVDPRAEVAADEHRARHLGHTAREHDHVADRRAGVDLDDSGTGDAAGEGDEDCARYRAGASEDRDVSEGLDILDERGRAIDAALERVRRDDRRRRETVVDQMDRGGLGTGDVARRSERKADEVPLRLVSLCERAKHGVARRVVAFAEVQDDAAGANGAGRDKGAVEGKVWARGHQDSVLLALRLTLGAVDDDDGIAGGPLCHRAPLRRCRKARAAAAGQAGAFEQIDESRPRHWDIAHRVRRVEQPHQRAWRRSTPARNVERCSASGSLGGDMRRTTPATATATTQPAVIASIHAEVVSVPVPIPWSTPTGHAAYVSQWIARQRRCPT